MVRNTVLVGILSSLIVTAGWAGDRLRKHSDGVLVASDFRGRVPQERGGLDAVVHTRLHYEFAYQYRELPKGVSLQCSAIRCYAELLPERSWIRFEYNKQLIDHEQGHFDLSEIVARKAHDHLNSLVQSGELEVVAETRVAAVRQLRDLVRESLQPFDDKLEQANREYDDLTEHGRNRHLQHLERLKQQRALSQTRHRATRQKQSAQRSPR